MSAIEWLSVAWHSSPIMRPELAPLRRRDTAACKRACLQLVIFLSASVNAVVSWRHGYWPLTVALWGVIAHVGHLKLFVLHECAHNLLHPRRLLNEAVGMIVGTFSLLPLSAYRYVHAYHHAYLGQARDVELWPYTDRSTSRAFRRLAAALELVLGAIWTPLVFLRGCLVARGARRARRIKRRLALEYGLCLASWASVCAIGLYVGSFEWLVVGYIVPILMTGWMQTTRRFIEHMGLLADAPESATRTIERHGRLGQLLSASLLHADVHGPHHVHPSIPQSRLPEALALLKQHGVIGQDSIYPGYWAAFKAMAPSLIDPRIGKHWLEAAPPALK